MQGSHLSDLSSVFRIVPFFVTIWLTFALFIGLILRPLIAILSLARSLDGVGHLFCISAPRDLSYTREDTMNRRTDILVKIISAAFLFCHCDCGCPYESGGDTDAETDTDTETEEDSDTGELDCLEACDYSGSIAVDLANPTDLAELRKCQVASGNPDIVVSSAAPIDGSIPDLGCLWEVEGTINIGALPGLDDISALYDLAHVDAIYLYDLPDLDPCYMVNLLLLDEIDCQTACIYGNGANIGELPCDEPELMLGDC